MAIQRSPAGKEAAETLKAKRGIARKNEKRSTRRGEPGPVREWAEEEADPGRVA